MEYVIFSGTTEGREISDRLCAGGICHHVCVATEYGEQMMKEDPHATVHVGRMDTAEMESMFKGFKELTILDATHPYAVVVSENIKKAAESAGAEYIRVLREGSEAEAGSVREENITYVADTAEAVGVLLESSGKVLLTTGSKEIGRYAENETLRERLVARVLPSCESITLCTEAGLVGKQIVAMHGPFSVDMNVSMIKDYNIDILVTKQSGVTGGYPEKLEAVRRAGIRAVVIGRPSVETGISADEAVRRILGDAGGCGALETSEGLETSSAIPFGAQIEVSLVGFGPGGKDHLTLGGLNAIEKADVIFGADRLVAEFPEKESFAYYLARDIVPVLEKKLCSMGPEKKLLKAAALFTGDSGYFSGAIKMRKALLDWMDDRDIEGTVRVLPGISSVSLFASRIGEGYSDSMLMSIHGRSADRVEIEKVFRNIRHNSKVFVLLSGAADARMLGEGLTARKLDRSCSIVLGSSLSYENEEIAEYTPSELAELQKEGLYIALVKNSDPQKLKIFEDINDDDYVRAKVPMTKEAIRHLSVVRLGLHEGDVMYDIGSGTGSIAVEAASLHDTIRVYAIEKKPEALELIAQNAKEHGCPNVVVVPGEAPEALDGLEAPDVAFIGGSSGQMKDILKLLRDRNPGVRVVVNAVSLETIAEIEQITKEFKLKNLVIEQLSVSRAKALGSYHLMMAENPVIIAAFEFADSEPECE